MMINKDFNTISELLEAFPDEQTCIDHLTKLRWHGNVVSPFDPTSKVYECKNNRYRCRNTGKYFNVRTGTLFDNTKVGLQKWFLVIWLVVNQGSEISPTELSRKIGVSNKTARLMLLRIQHCFNNNI